jgi:hypothetical protein
MALNPRQAKFAELYHRYGNATRAYGEAYDSPKTDGGTFPNWVSVDGNRLLRNEKVKAEVARLKGETSALSALTREEMTDYLVSAITTPVGEIGPDSPLCEEYEVKPDGSVKTKCVSKLGAAKELARLCGWQEAQKVEIGASDEVKEMLSRLTGAKK